MNRWLVPQVLGAFVWCPASALALCVSNDTNERLHFTVEAAESGARQAGPLDPGATLCIPDSMTGVVAAFEFADSIEGCSRLATGAESLVAFARFDRCTWASHLQESAVAKD